MPDDAVNTSQRVAASLRSDLLEAWKMQQAGDWPEAAGFLNSAVLFAIARLDGRAPVLPSDLDAIRQELGIPTGAEWTKRLREQMSRHGG